MRRTRLLAVLLAAAVGAASGRPSSALDEEDGPFTYAYQFAVEPREAGLYRDVDRIVLPPLSHDSDDAAYILDLEDLFDLPTFSPPCFTAQQVLQDDQPPSKDRSKGASRERANVQFFLEPLRLPSEPRDAPRDAPGPAQLHAGHAPHGQGGHPAKGAADGDALVGAGRRRRCLDRAALGSSWKRDSDKNKNKGKDKDKDKDKDGKSRCCSSPYSSPCGSSKDSKKDKDKDKSCCCSNDGDKDSEEKDKRTGHKGHDFSVRGATDLDELDSNLLGFDMFGNPIFKPTPPPTEEEKQRQDADEKAIKRLVQLVSVIKGTDKHEADNSTTPATSS